MIIGSGITAASAAHHLLALDPSINVTIVEARTLCSGATGRNGGHVLELPYEDFDMEVALHGKEAAKKLIQFRIDHLHEILNFVQTELSDEAAKRSEIREVEVVDAFFDSKHFETTKAQLSGFFQTFPEQVNKWAVFERDEARKKFGMPHIFGAITGPSGAIWPYRFVTSVFENLRSKYPDRIHIETNTPVRSLTTSSSESRYPYVATTPRGEIQAKHVVHATNGHAAYLLPRLQGKIFPIRGQMTVQNLSGSNKPANLGSTRSWLPRYSKGYDYLTQNPATGDYFLGGGALQGGLDDIGNSADNEQSFLALCHLSGALPRMFGAASGDDALSSTVKASWTGTLGFSCDGRPWVGKLPKEITERYPRFEHGGTGGEYIAAGYCGSGMVYCWRSGRGIADMILGRDMSWFPECLLPTESRYRSSDSRDMVAYWLDLTIN